jgi:hypothetical protein
MSIQKWLSRTTLDAVFALHPMAKIELFLNLVQFAGSLLSWQERSRGRRKIGKQSIRAAVPVWLMDAKSLKPSNSCFSCGSSGVGVRQLKQEISHCTLWFVHEDLPKCHGGNKRVAVSSDRFKEILRRLQDFKKHLLVLKHLIGNV